MTADDTAGAHLTEIERLVSLADRLAGRIAALESAALLTAARATRSGQGEAVAADDPSVFIGSIALITALYDTYVEHIGIVEPDGPEGPYMWCACGWRSDDLPERTNHGEGYAVHLTNAQHAAAVKALQPIVKRILPAASTTAQDAEGGEVERLRAAVEACEVNLRERSRRAAARAFGIHAEYDDGLSVAYDAAADDLRAVLDRDTPNGGGE